MKNHVQSPPARFSDFAQVRRLSFFWIIAVVGMVALLLTVAVLQYRWTSKITEASETRIGNNVESLMLDWHLDLYRQFAGICVALQVGPDSGEHDNWLAYRERYSRWSREHPKMVEHVYIWETSQRRGPRLFRIGASQEPLKIADPPEKLSELLARLRERSQDITEGLWAWELKESTHTARTTDPGLARYNPITGWQFDQNVPAIVHPIIHHPLEGKDNSIGQAVDWIVVVLDLDVIREEVLPDITKKYIADNEYELSVGVGGSSEHLIYPSGKNADSERSDADATMNIFGLPPESTEGYFWGAFKNRNSLTGLEWHKFSGSVWFPVFQYRMQQQPWTLILRKQNGSLLAAMATLRRKNMITPALVLLLLIASMTLVAVATHRAQRLAWMEMEFVASVSHELRTPLSAILSAGENIADGFIDGKPALFRYGNIITTQATQLIDLVDQVLLFATSRDDSVRYQLQPLRVEDVLQSVRQNIAGLLQKTGCSVEQSVPKNLPYVLGDTPALTRCLQNLVTNAIKYSPRNGMIAIIAEISDLGTAGKELRIHVRDNGIGISPSEMKHIFEPFYRSPRVISAQIHGTGLGLALAKAITGALGGSLSVESVVGKGSTFTLHLPIPPQENLDQELYTTTGWVKQE
ncbi:MAG TPA: HAMP domain-containing sensor histidine kinase [Candidatus Binatia bacterium]|nr:HAMP domain-containing sensor histidine kinase [Candidatus Binatia bacterium]